MAGSTSTSTGLGKTFFKVRKDQPGAEQGKFVLEECLEGAEGSNITVHEVCLTVSANGDPEW
jgi:hypothetical protein